MNRAVQQGAFLLIFMLMLAPSVFSDPLLPEEAVQRALAGDPRLKRDQALAEGAAAYSEGAGALPNPILQLSGVRGDSREDANSISQTFEIAGQPRLRKEASGKDSEAALALLESTRRAVIRETGLAYYDFWEARSLREVHAKQLQFATELDEAAKKRLGLGDISPLEAFRVEQMKSQADLAFLQAEGEVAVRGRRLELLVGAEVGSTELPFPGEIPTAPSFQARLNKKLDFYEESLLSRPELVLAEREAEREDLKAKLAGRAGAPDVQLTAYRSSLGSVAAQGVQFSVVVPLFDWGRLGAVTAQKKKVAQAKLYEVEVVRRRILLELHSAYTRYQVALERRNAARVLAGGYLRFFQTARQGYEIGLLSFLEASDSQTANLRGFEDYVRAEADCRRAEVELWWASGLTYRAGEETD